MSHQSCGGGGGGCT